MPKIVDRKYFRQFFTKGAKPHVIKMFSDSCGVCHELEPDYNRLAQELGEQYEFVKFDVDTDDQVAELMAVDGVPTIHVFKDEQIHEIKYSDAGYSYDYLKESILNETNLKKDGE